MWATPTSSSRCCARTRKADMAPGKTPSKAFKDPYIERFEVESDARLFRFMGLFLILGAAFISYMVTVHAVIPTVLTIHNVKEVETKVVVKTDDIKKEKKEEKKKEDKRPPQAHEGGGAPRGHGIPHAAATQAAL